MANEVKWKLSGQQLSFADHAGDFSPTSANDLESGSQTNVQLTLASLGTTPNARQSAEFDLGATFAEKYALRLAVEIAATPTAGRTIAVYIGWSDNGTAYPANLGTSDAAYSGYSSNLAASLRQLQLVGLFVVTAQATTTVQVLENQMPAFEPRGRHGVAVLVNDSGAALHSDDVESHVVMTGLVPEIQ